MHWQYSLQLKTKQNKNTFGIQGGKLNWFKNIYQCMSNFYFMLVALFL